MATLRIDSVQKSKSGKAWQVRSGDSWYTAYLDSGIDSCVGQTLDVEIKTFGKDGKAIDKYRVVGGPGTQPQTAPTSPQNNAGASLGVPPVVNWLPGASNTVNAAIAAGLVKTPAEIKQWVFAWKSAAEVPTASATAART